MLKNKLSYYFWRVAVGVSIGLILMFAKSNAFALTLDGSIVTEVQVFNSNVIYSRTSSSTNNPDGIQKIFDFNYSNSSNHDYIVFPAIGVMYNRNYYTGDDVNNVITFSSFDIFNAFVSIKLIPTAGQWVSCELQNNFIVCPMLPNTTYKGLEFIISNAALPSSSEVGFSLTLNKYAWIYDKDKDSKEIAKNTKETAQNTKKIADEVSDNSDPNIDVSGMSGVQGLLPAGPLDSLLSLPVNLLNILVNATSGTCEPFTFTFVFDTQWELPCFDTFWNQVPSALLLFMSDLPAVYIFIKWAKSIYKRVERAVSFESSVEDEWGGV